MYLVHNICAVVSVFWLWRKIVLKIRTPFDFLWAFSTKKSQWVTLLWSASQCVYFVRPKTLLLCIFLFCTFLLYALINKLKYKSKYYLWINMWIVSNANTGNHTMISCTQFLRKFCIGFLYFTETTRKPRYISHKIQIFCYCVSLSCICMDLQPYSHDHFPKISRSLCASRN